MSVPFLIYKAFLRLIQIAAIIVWISGIVIASGFWSTFFAFIFPFWAWYLAIESLITSSCMV